MARNMFTIFSVLSAINLLCKCEAQNNIALGKPVVQSSTAGPEVATHGNDGNITTITHTYNTPPTFWYIDLQGRYRFTSIVLHRRIHVCATCLDRWQDLIVGIGDEPPTGNEVPGLDFRVCHVFHSPPSMGSSTQLSCTSSGRYVMLFSNATRFLSVAEVEIYGIPDQGQGSSIVQLSFEKYQNKDNVIRQVNVLEELPQPTKMRCAIMCRQEEKCAAFTYYSNTCRLHYLHAQHYLGDEDQFETQQGAVYYQTVINPLGE